MKVAFFQFSPFWEDVERNLEIIENAIKSVSGKVQAIFFSEMALSGFTMNPQKVYLNRSKLDILKSLSLHAAIGVGFVEKDGSEFYNAYSIFQSGEEICRYRKIHLFTHGNEHKFYKRGDSIVTCKINDVSITPFICYDLRFPGIFQKAAEDTDLFVVPASWPAKRENHWRSLLTARAIENQAYVVGINRIGKDPFFEYSGASLVVNPWSEIIEDAKGEEGIFIFEIDPKEVKRVRSDFPVLKGRIPGLDI